MPASEGIRSDQTGKAFTNADLVGTAMITPPEMASAFSMAIRRNIITEDEGASAWNMFQKDWDAFFVVDLNQALIGQASTLVWKYGLRGYDSVHLASLLVWQDALGENISLATYDVKLWEAAKRIGIDLIPGKTPRP